MLVVCVATTALAFLLLHPQVVRHYVESLVAALAFGANIFFYFWQDYFAPASELELLLHTWTLGVEEQFYIFFPLIFLFAYSRGKAVAFILSALLVSLALAVSSGDRDAAFYLLPYRAWEFGVGALIAVVRYRNQSFDFRRAVIEPLAVTGLVLMVVAIFMTPKSASTEYLMLAVIGAGLITLLGDKS